MMVKKYKLHEVSQLSDREIFFDANILIYLFWPTGQHYYEQNYARVFRAILNQGNLLFVDFFVISEIINRILRNEHQKLNPTSKFKDFRDSTDGKQVLTDIYLILKSNVLNRFNIVGKKFSKQDIENFLVIDDLDFVDKSTAAICKENKLVLLTNDKDFKHADLDILTGNPNLLN